MFNKKKMLNENPGILVANHGGFCWGNTSEKSFLNFQRLEFIAKLSFKTLMINPNSKISHKLVKKHFNRKHGPKAYYGQ